MKRITFVLFGLLGPTAACGGGTKVSPADSADATAEASLPYAAECAGAAVPPASIECTGLYADLATKQLAPGVRSYAPAVPLWSDGAEKERWISLPPGTQIYAGDPSEWVFPVGTKVWKQFRRDGKRIETRLFQKTQPGYWVRTTYAWSDDESAATISPGETCRWVRAGARTTSRRPTNATSAIAAATTTCWASSRYRLASRAPRASRSRSS